eukprot:2605980-Amphidinium_carterae.1
MCDSYLDGGVHSACAALGAKLLAPSSGYLWAESAHAQALSMPCSWKQCKEGKPTRTYKPLAMQMNAARRA